MKFQPDSLAGTNVITRHDADALWVGGTRFDHSLLVPWQGTVLRWAPAQPDELTHARWIDLNEPANLVRGEQGI